MRFNQFVRKACFLVLGVGACLPLMAAAADNDGLVKMVTYFPVPYAAYNAVFVQNKFDVGTNKASFTLNLGDASSCKEGTNPLPSLTAEDIVLRNHSSSSVLSFGSDMYTPTAKFGELKDGDDNTLQFNGNLRVNRLSTNSGYPLQSVSAPTVNVDKHAYVFPDSVNTSALPKCDETVSWQRFKLGNDTNEHYFLVCGQPQACLGQDDNLKALCLNNDNDDAYVQGTWNSTDADCLCQCSFSSSRHTKVSDDKKHCECQVGYRKKNYYSCEEIPCYKDTHLTKYNACTNSGGTWTDDMSMTADKCCSCQEGYRVNSSGACEEIPCHISTHQTKYNACTNSGGSWNASETSASACCSCPTGYNLNSSGECEEIPCYVSTHQAKYNACTGSGGTWNANATSSSACCNCGDKTLQDDGTCKSNCRWEATSESVDPGQTSWCTGTSYNGVYPCRGYLSFDRTPPQDGAPAASECRTEQDAGKKDTFCALSDHGSGGCLADLYHYTCTCD